MLGYFVIDLIDLASDIDIERPLRGRSSQVEPLASLRLITLSCSLAQFAKLLGEAVDIELLLAAFD